VVIEAVLKRIDVTARIPHSGDSVCDVLDVFVSENVIGEGDTLCVPLSLLQQVAKANDEIDKGRLLKNVAGIGLVEDSRAEQFLDAEDVAFAILAIVHFHERPNEPRLSRAADK
jgi:hypothetical protein